MLPLAYRKNSRSPKVTAASSWVGWLPVAILPAVALSFRESFPAWGCMWLLAGTIYISLKWLTWWQARIRVKHSISRSVAYLLAWPGMDARSFLNDDGQSRMPEGSASKLAWAIVKIASGAVLLWIVARSIPATEPLIQGWIGMAGLILLLHFGTFDVIAFIWQRRGIDARPIMSAPLRSASLSEFWGKRWNLGFRQLAHEFVFRRLRQPLGAAAASFLVFVASGLVHDLVISAPARAGYGLPAAYFILQGAGIMFERSAIGRRTGLGGGIRGRLFMLLVVAAPAYWLFHRWFVLRVMIPFMRVIHAL